MHLLYMINSRGIINQLFIEKRANQKWLALFALTIWLKLFFT